MKNLLLLIITIFCAFTNDCISQNIWEPTNGPNGIFINDFLVKNDSILIISSYNGMFMTRDKGKSWNIFNNGLPYPNVGLTNLTSGPFGIFYGFYGDILYRYDLIKSRWESTGHKFSYHIQLAEAKTEDLFVLDDEKKGIYFSRDSGNTFNLVYQNNDIRVFYLISFNGNDNNFFVTVENGPPNLYKINDDGSGAHIIQEGIDASFLVWHPSGFLFSDAYPTGLWRMDAMGDNRELLKINKNDSDNYVYKLVVEPNGNLLAITQKGDFESSNFGKDWQAIPKWFNNFMFDFGNVYFAEKDVYVFNGNCYPEQLWWSDNFGKSWSSIVSRFLFPSVTNIFDDKLGNIFAKDCSSYYMFNNLSKDWRRINNPISNREVPFDLVSTSIGNLILNTPGNLFLSQDNGNTWKELKINKDSSFIKLVSDQDKLIFAFGSYSYRSINGGLNWDSISNLPSQNLDFYFHPDGTIFGIPNSLSTDNTIYYSEDTGRNWLSNIDFSFIRSFYITRSGLMYIEGAPKFQNFGIYTSVDKFKSLNFLSLTSMDVEDLKVDENGKLYGIQPFYGLCLTSLDNGKTWENFKSGLPDGAFSTSLILDNDQYLYIGIGGHEVYRTNHSVVNTFSAVTNENLLNISPNPASGTTTITISNKNISSGHYKIIDLNGIEKLKGNFHSNNFTIDCSTLVNGMAFIQIFGKGNSHYTEKIVIAH